jgi:NAD(P)H dehydrogenase (quinone)
MNISVILAHPVADSFDHAIAEAVLAQLRQNCRKVSFHDLYREAFDPLLPSEEIAAGSMLPPYIAAYCEEIEIADSLVFVHPNWWGQPPAVLKGWVDGDRS